MEKISEVTINSYEILVKDYNYNKDLYPIPVRYICYADGNKLVNLKGDSITPKTPVSTSIQNVKSDLTIDNEAILVDKIMDCKSNIINPEEIVLLIGDKLFNIYGDIIEIDVSKSQPQPQAQAPQEEPKKPVEKPVEKPQPKKNKCC